MWKFRRKKSNVDRISRTELDSNGNASDVLDAIVPEAPLALDKIPDVPKEMEDSSKQDHLGSKKLYIKCDSIVEPSTSSDGKIHNIVYVNDDFHPHLINNPHFTGHLVFRVRDFQGVTPVDAKTGLSKPNIPYTPYFDGHKRAFSLQISGRFKKPWTADDILFGTFFERPLVLPRGYSLALALAKRIDRSMVTELDRSDPFMCSPLICAMNLLHIYPLWGALVPSSTKNSSKLDPLPLPTWQWGGSCRLTESVVTEWAGTAAAAAAVTTKGPHHSRSLTVPNTSHSAGVSDSMAFSEDLTAFDGDPALLPDSRSLKNASNRRSYFLDQEARRRFIYHPDTVYSFDFFSPYVDLNKMQLKLGITIDASYYLNGQPVTYQCRSRDGSTVFFTIELGLT